MLIHSATPSSFFNRWCAIIVYMTDMRPVCDKDGYPMRLRFRHWVCPKCNTKEEAW